MSAHFYNLECTGCNFENSFLQGGTKYIFRGDDKEKPFDKNFGYCRNCNNVTRILESYKINHIPVYHQDLQNYKKFKGSNSLKRFFRSKSDKEAEEIIEREMPRVNYYSGRAPYFPRCMECANKSVKKIELPSTLSSQKVLIDETHLCGGQLVVSYVGRMSFNEVKTQEFTRDGIIDTTKHDNYCKRVASEARIETVLEKGSISGFFIYMVQPYGKFVMSFRYESSCATFRKTIDTRVSKKDFVDDRVLFDRGLEPQDSSHDDYGAYRVVF